MRKYISKFQSFSIFIIKSHQLQLSTTNILITVYQPRHIVINNSKVQNGDKTTLILK